MAIVWSDDPKDQCPKCHELKNSCRCRAVEKPFDKSKFVAIFRLEKSGRAGKIVTVIDNLPKQEIFLKELTKELKSKCGVGGTYSVAGQEGLVEIQGDKRTQIKAIFDQKGIKYKGM